jgi:hypothetical protein
MARSKKSAFSTSDFQAKALTTGSVNVAAVSGYTNIGSSRNYTATVSTLVSETTASLTTVLDSVTASTGNSLSIVTELPIIVTPASVSQSNVELTTLTTETSGLTASGTLSLVGGVSSYRDLSLVIDVSGGGYTLNDVGSSVLSADNLQLSAVSGSIVGDTWTIDFTNQEILTNGTEISATYDIAYPYETVVTDIVIKHSVGPDAPNDGTASAVLSAQSTDTNGIASFTSSTFTLSTDSTPDDNPWNGRGALPGETTLETRGRFIDEGII